MHAGEELFLVQGDPPELRGGEIAGGIQQRSEAAFMSESVEGLPPDLRGPAVAPDDRRTEHVSPVVHNDKPVHLVGDAHRADALQVGPCVPEYLLRRLLQVFPPHRRVLFGPAGLACEYGHLLFRPVRLREGDAAFGVEKDRLDG